MSSHTFSQVATQQNVIKYFDSRTANYQMPISIFLIRFYVNINIYM